MTAPAIADTNRTDVTSHVRRRDPVTGGHRHVSVCADGEGATVGFALTGLLCLCHRVHWEDEWDTRGKATAEQHYHGFLGHPGHTLLSPPQHSRPFILLLQQDLESL